MQTQIHCVAKTCSEFVTRMEEVETRISRLENDVGSQKLTRDTMEKQLEDTQWKLTDLEDRLRRNNLRVLGIPEGVEGSDPQRRELLKEFGLVLLACTQQKVLTRGVAILARAGCFQDGRSRISIVDLEDQLKQTEGEGTGTLKTDVHGSQLLFNIVTCSITFFVAANEKVV
ncbi:hypothetical protein NDU88_006003 [Pleurodeles waltl]|uniref:Uncharacterized protein n=1 Tax=Pleurodeles waltl TaxID=8319 RepID=A0AAV7TVW5_PLEWA|nr:hypothetical protein NDU88_006003 [Pleurodeles waltl]